MIDYIFFKVITVSFSGKQPDSAQSIQVCVCVPMRWTSDSQPYLNTNTPSMGSEGEMIMLAGLCFKSRTCQSQQ